MPIFLKQLIFGMSALLLIAGCETISAEGQSKLSLISGNPKPATADEFSRYNVVHDDPRLEQIRRVGCNIVKVALRRDEHEVLPPVEKWEFEIIKDNSPNAFVFPDGKVGFNTGMFSFVVTDDDVAVILGHEVADILTHITKEHINGMPAEQSPRTGTRGRSLGVNNYDAGRL